MYLFLFYLENVFVGLLKCVIVGDGVDVLLVGDVFGIVSGWCQGDFQFVQIFLIGEGDDFFGYVYGGKVVCGCW